MNLNLSKNIIQNRILVFTIILFSTIRSTPGFAESDCLSLSDIEKSLGIRQSTALAVKNGLEKLNQGLASQKIVPGALFTVDLTDENAVTKRAEELKNSIDSNKADAALESIRPCITKNEKLQKTIDDLILLEKEVAELKLAFLYLPEERRNALLSAHEDTANQESALSELAADKRNAILRSNESDDSLRTAENLAQTAESEDLRRIASERALIEKRR